MITKNDKRINKLFEELVPASGKAENLAGELVRAMARIGYRSFNDSDHIGVGYGKETCNPAARFLRSKGNKEIRELVDAIWGIENDRAYDAVLDQLTGAVADYVEGNPALRELPTEDMWDFRDPDEDVDDWEDEEEEEEEEAWDEDDEDDEDGYWG